MYWAIMICAPVTMPMVSAVHMVVICPASETPVIPSGPTNCPTITVSTRL